MVLGNFVSVYPSKLDDSSKRPTVLAVGVGGDCSEFFFCLFVFLAYHFSFLSPSLWETACDGLNYCLKRPFTLLHSVKSHRVFAVLGTIGLNSKQPADQVYYRDGVTI